LLFDPLKIIASLIIDTQNNINLSHISLGGWKTLERLAVDHGVAPLLYKKLSTKGEKVKLPERVSDEFKNDVYQSTAKNTLLLAELEKILSILSEVNVNVILIKGASLTRKIYPDISLRPMTDIDFIVHPDHLRKVTASLKKLRYHEQKSTYHTVFWGGPAQNIMVEVHWNLMNSRLTSSLDEVEWIWKDAYQDGNAYSLRLEKELLYQVGHMAIQHDFTTPRLIWLFDLYLFIEKYFNKLDWDYVIDNALMLGWNRELYDSLQVSADYFPSKSMDLSLGKFSVDFITRDQSETNRNWVPRALRGMGFHRGLLTIKGMIFPGFAYMQWRYHVKKRKYIFLYYPKRWFELLAGLYNHHDFK
jgi:hypothetical protein